MSSPFYLIMSTLQKRKSYKYYDLVKGQCYNKGTPLVSDKILDENTLPRGLKSDRSHFNGSLETGDWKGEGRRRRTSRHGVTTTSHRGSMETTILSSCLQIRIQIQDSQINLGNFTLQTEHSSLNTHTYTQNSIIGTNKNLLFIRSLFMTLN